MIGHGVSSLLVPLRGGGAHDVGREAVDPVADVALVLGELEVERDGLVGDGQLDRFGAHAAGNLEQHLFPGPGLRVRIAV